MCSVKITLNSIRHQFLPLESTVPINNEITRLRFDSDTFMWNFPVQINRMLMVMMMMGMARGTVTVNSYQLQLFQDIDRT